MTARTRMGFVATCLIVGLLAAGPAEAARPGTKGSAQASFQAWLTGGQAIVGNELDAPAAPTYADGDSPATLRPFGPWNRRHVCQSDWILLVAANFDGNFEGMDPRTTQAILANLAATTVEMTLDGAPLDTDRTASKRLVGFPSDEATDVYGFQQGAILAPGTLDAGRHTFGVSIDDPFWGAFESSISFYVDAAGTGVCVS